MDTIPTLASGALIKLSEACRCAFDRTWCCAPVLLSVSALLWSGNFVVARAVQGTIAPIDLAFWRWLAALAFVAWMARDHLKHDLGELRRCWASLLLLAAVGIAAMNTLVYRGLQSTTALNALLLQSAVPLLVLGCTFVLYGERPRLRQVVAVVISMVGVAVIAARWTPVGARQTFSFGVGDLWILAAMLCYALYTALLLRRRPLVHPTSFLVASFTLGAAMLLPFEVGAHLQNGVTLPGLVAVLAVIYMALFPSFAAFLCFNRGVELIGASRAGHYVHLMPVFGSVLSIAFLGEVLHSYHVVGVAAIAGGFLLAGSSSQTAVASRPPWHPPTDIKPVQHRSEEISVGAFAENESAVDSRPASTGLARHWHWILLWRRRAAERQELRCAGGRIWRDLGPGRASDEADKPFWYE